MSILNSVVKSDSSNLSASVSCNTSFNKETLKISSLRDSEVQGTTAIWIF